MRIPLNFTWIWLYSRWNGKITVEFRENNSKIFNIEKSNSGHSSQIHPSALIFIQQDLEHPTLKWDDSTKRRKNVAYFWHTKLVQYNWLLPTINKDKGHLRIPYPLEYNQSGHVILNTKTLKFLKFVFSIKNFKKICFVIIVPKFNFFVIFVRKIWAFWILDFKIRIFDQKFKFFVIFLSKISFICPKSEFLGHFWTKMRFFVWHFDEEWPRIWTSVIGSNQECTLEWSGHVKSDF